MPSLQSRLLNALSPWRAAPAWRVALSGGLDSSALLHMLVRLSEREPLPPVSAIHVHHGLQPAADGWVTACQQLCDRLDVPLQVCHVQVAPTASLEAAAREARYRAFAAHLEEGEVLLIAQHADDQAETLLFRLLRGAGVRGLAGMPTQRALGSGSLLRPLLDCRRAELEAYAVEQGLTWQEDPSNADQRYARNYLRHQVLPAFRQRWPQASLTLARTAGHCQEAQQLLDELAQLDLQAASGASMHPWLPCPSLDLAPLAALSDARQRNAMRCWLARFGDLPDSDHWTGWRDLRDAGADAEPIWVVGAGQLRRAGGRIWWLQGDWLQVPPGLPQALRPGCGLALPGNGTVHLQGEVTPGRALQVRYRQPGQDLELPRRGHRDLKRLLNEQAVPAFVRDRLPLLCDGERVLAVANLPALNACSEAGWRFVWEPPTGAGNPPPAAPIKV